MAFTLVHTADWQLGLKAQHVGAASEAVRAARFKAAERVVALCAEVQAQALVLAGDTFEDSSVPPELIQRTVDLLRRCSAHVLVLPANHDPLVPRGIFDHPAWQDAAANVTVVRGTTPITVDGVEFLGSPLRSRKSHVDPLSALPAETGPRNRIRIGIAHGSIVGGALQNGEIANDFPMDLSHIARAGLDYLALGHWHIPSQHQVDGVVRAAYSGSHEPTKFGEASADGARASGQCLVVRLPEPGAPPVIETHRTAVMEWRQKAVSLATRQDVQELRQVLDREPPEALRRTLLDLTLTGRIAPSEELDLRELETLASARFLHARVRKQELLVQPGDHAWLASLPGGAPQAVAERLVEQAMGEGRDAEVARVALLQLFELSREQEA